MNCLLETIASIWMLSFRAAVPGPGQIEEEEEGIHDNLEGCRNSLESREADLAEGCRRLGREALKRRQAGDLPGAKIKMLERRRACKRLEKLRSSLSLVDAQLDALRTTELDKELMQTLLASSAALKKAGVGKGVKEAETVMSELDEQLRESSELTSVLAGGLQDVDGDCDFDEEFELLEQESELFSGVGTASLMSQSARHEIGSGVTQVSHNRPSVVNNLIEDTDAPSRQHLPAGGNASLITD
jgi:hypothetical protein